MNKLQADWLLNNQPSVTIEPTPPKSIDEVEQSIKEHKRLSIERSLTTWPEATRERAKFKVSDDYTTFNYGD